MTMDRVDLALLRRLERSARPLEPGAGERRRLRNAAVASAERFLHTIDTLKAFDESGDQGRGLLAAPISEHGLPIERAIEMLERDVLRPGGNPASAGHLAYIPGERSIPRRSATAITTARDAHCLRSADIPSAVVYLTSQAHHCIEKALHIAGLSEAQVRHVAIDERFRMRPEALEEAIAAGSTSTRPTAASS